MILTCPSCRTRYQTDGAHFTAPGRNVRCAKCGQVWFQSAPELEAALEPEAIVVPVVSVVHQNVEPAPEPVAAEHGAHDSGTTSKVQEAQSVSEKVLRRSRGAAFA